jgi:hypothetical protein
VGEIKSVAAGGFQRYFSSHSCFPRRECLGCTTCCPQNRSPGKSRRGGRLTWAGLF